MREKPDFKAKASGRTSELRREVKTTREENSRVFA